MHLLEEIISKHCVSFGSQLDASVSMLLYSLARFASFMLLIFLKRLAAISLELFHIKIFWKEFCEDILSEFTPKLAEKEPCAEFLSLFVRKCYISDGDSSQHIIVNQQKLKQSIDSNLHSCLSIPRKCTPKIIRSRWCWSGPLLCAFRWLLLDKEKLLRIYDAEAQAGRGSQWGNYCQAGRRVIPCCFHSLSRRCRYLREWKQSRALWICRATGCADVLALALFQASYLLSSSTSSWAAFSFYLIKFKADCRDKIIEIHLMVEQSRKTLPFDTTCIIFTYFDLP